jgi:ketosteroid isomerase-like protein/uncharacterized glyoxalase superfamily protein PhnB
MNQAHDHSDSETVAAQLRAAFESRDLAALGAVLDDDVRWGGEEDTPETCRSRAQVLERLAHQRANGVETGVIEVVPGHQAVLLGLTVKRPVGGDFSREHNVYQVLSLRDGRVVDIRGYPERATAAARAGIRATGPDALQARHLVPILNVSNLSASFDWFTKLGWAKQWDWRNADGTPGFGAVKSGDCELFLSLNGQGGQGMWLSIWVDDVDALHEACVREGLEVLRPPRDEPWGVREMHLRHPDGHVFRIGTGLQ